MIFEDGDWVQYRGRFSLTPADEVDFHAGRRDPREHRFYGEQFDGMEDQIADALKRAQANGRPYVMFTHGRSTSRPGQPTARSIVRGFMRSKAATPLIDRAGSIQHPSVFVAKVKPVR